MRSGGYRNGMKRRSITITGIGALLLSALAAPAEAATNTFAVVNSGLSAYAINGVNNQNLKLVRGFAYNFAINAPGHPFWIKSIQGTGTANAYTNGVSGNGTSSGTILFTVPSNAPSLLFYNCEFHSGMTGRLDIEDTPVVRVVALEAGTNLIIRTTGTDALNLRLAVSSDLLTQTWSNLPSFVNSYAQGTNTTSIAAPLERLMFFRVSQTLP